MSIYDFDAFHTNNAIIQKDLYPAKLYALYVNWLIEKQNLKRFSASELLVQLYHINNYVLLNAQKNDGRLQRYVKSRIKLRNQSIERYRTQLQQSATSIEKSFRETYLIVGMLGLITSGLIVAYAIETTAAIAISSVALSTFVLPFILVHSFKLLSMYLTQAWIYLTDPMSDEVESKDQASFNSLLKNALFEHDEENESLIEKTSLTLFETKYPLGVWSENTPEEDDELELNILSAKLMYRGR